MKSLFFLLALCILSLSVIPCSDAKECDPPVAAKISAAANHQAHNHAEEACAPFCTCSCCAATAFCAVIHKPQIGAYAFFSVKNDLYNSALIQQAHHAIWQPPRNA